MNHPSPIPPSTRTRFITPGQITRGTITEVNVNQEPFHCTIKILPEDLMLMGAEGRYSDHEVSMGKLKRNLVHLKFNVKDFLDIIAAVESLEGRDCVFRVDKSGWISWILRLVEEAPVAPEPVSPAPVPGPAPAKLSTEREGVEIFFVREGDSRSIYKMENEHGWVLGYAVGPTDIKSPKPHGWVLHLQSKEEARQILKKRKEIT